MAASDTVTATPNITCVGAFTSSPLRYSAGVTATFAAGNTTVSCWAQDDAGNQSPNQTFSVMATCANGLSPSGGLCKGEFVGVVSPSVVGLNFNRSITGVHRETWEGLRRTTFQQACGWACKSADSIPFAAQPRPRPQM